MDSPARAAGRQSNAYELFILVLTVYSLVIMVALVLPLSDSTLQLLGIYDNGICLVFLGDFAMRLAKAPSKRGYFFGERGWLDLLGSVPSLGFFRFTALLRLARLSRLARITRLFRGQRKSELVRDLVVNRGQYAGFVTFLAAFLVLSVSSVLVLQFESVSPQANITTGEESLWWSAVTLTTVGYGDYYPVTAGGRIVAAVVMLVGVGIIASLASILSRVMVPTEESPVDALGEVTRQLDELRLEVARLREDLAGASTDGPDEG
ncbi:potassium channel family protein [Nocardioides sp.]|uniref:potassium channel family protein n=1 Tax=Nocardioides sp. TaxID=35761 RepID=UPI003783348D